LIPRRRGSIDELEERERERERESVERERGACAGLK
jgi:hypothetical protein